MASRPPPRFMSEQATAPTGVSEDAADQLEALLGEVPEVPPVQESLGARLESVDQGRATFAMEAGPEQHNIVNVVHGGTLTSLAELAASAAVLTTLDDDEAFTFVSQTTNYERPVVEGRVEAEARIVRRGSRITFVEVLLERDGEEAARAEYTALIQDIGVDE